MKKIMFMLGVVAMAAGVQAASMKWASGGIGLPPSGSGSATASSVTAQLFVLDSTEYGALQTAVSGKTAAEVSTYIYDNYKSATADVTGGNWSKGAVTQTQSGTFTTGDSVYAVVLYTATVDETDYYIGNYGTWTFAADASKTMNNMGTKLNGTGDALAWQAVASTPDPTPTIPEPTSGLLMLVGLGALALRRRRA